MTAEESRAAYLFAASNAVHTRNMSRRFRHQLWLQVDAASIQMDLAVAQSFPCHGLSLRERQEACWGPIKGHEMVREVAFA